MSSPSWHTRRLSGGLATTATLLALAGAAWSQTAQVATPPGWYAGDSHVHVQQCDTPINLTLPEVEVQMEARHLDVAAVQLWGSPWTPWDYFQNHYAPWVTGTEEPLSSPVHRLQYSLEISGFEASQFGHVQILQAQDANFPIFAAYPGPILEYYDDALRGYAHVSWFEGYGPVPFYAGTNGAYMAAVDAALGDIDFVETTRVEPEPWMGDLTWRGLYYKLLNSGLRLSLVAGSDNSCFVTEIGDQRTFAQLGNEPLSYAAWCQAIAAGRTTVSSGEHRFLDLEVDGTGIGGQISLAQPGVLNVEVTLSVTPGQSDSGWLHLLRDGRDVARAPYTLPAGGTTTLSVSLPMSESGWLSARCLPGAHTGAIYVYVQDRPIVRAEDATYWMGYCDEFAAHLGDYDVPEAESQILQRIAMARAHFAALAQCDQPLPDATAGYGLSSPACEGPITIGLTGAPGEPFALTCVNAPPGASGLLVMGMLPDTSDTTIQGCTPLVACNAPYIVLPATADDAGFALVPNPLPPNKPFRAQFVWLNPPSCDLGGRLRSSNGLAVGR